MSEPYIFQMQDLRKIHPGGKEVLKGIYLSFYHGAKIGVLGNNGAGKSTLLRIMAGVDKEFMGEARLQEGKTVGFLQQEPQLEMGKTVLENIEGGVKKIRDLLNRFDAVNNAFGEPDADMDKLMLEQGRLQDLIDVAQGWDINRILEQAMEALRCPPPDQIVDTLSGGEKRRVALCRLLLEKPDMLILDEPTNHLDAESVAWLERFLHDFKGTVICVTHDRYFLDNVAGWILELDRGAGIPWQGNYSSWLDQKKKRLEGEEKSESARQRELAREAEWAKASPKARQAKSKARLQRYEQLLNEATSEKVTQADIYIPPGPRLGDLVIEAQNVKKSYGDKLLFENLSFRLPPAGIVGVIGPNGAGKTTLFKLITGAEKPDSGEFKVGSTVKLMVVDQGRESLNNDNTVFQEITGGAEVIELGTKKMNSRAYCTVFNFRGADQNKLVGTLSGGERNRLQMAKLLKSGGNVLLLDEPTNDLDIDTLRALEGAIESFAGCVVVVSHDRWFLDRIATHILAFEGGSQVVWFEGNYNEYEADKRKRLGDIGPTRIKYKPLPKM
ncbi:MAG: energy-dependent translational throttle protein EttA [Deltaproteobacteria bacterium]|nr:energy-dependent translational throttle protein EttA [Deltaproteobacteria bacterium]